MWSLQNWWEHSTSPVPPCWLQQEAALPQCAIGSGSYPRKQSWILTQAWPFPPRVKYQNITHSLQPLEALLRGPRWWEAVLGWMWLLGQRVLTANVRGYQIVEMPASLRSHSRLRVFQPRFIPSLFFYENSQWSFPPALCLLLSLGGVTETHDVIDWWSPMEGPHGRGSRRGMGWEGR